MNALGVDYATSSDEEEEQVRRDVVVTEQSAATPAVASVESPANTAIEIAGLPSEPPGAANPEVQARIARLLALQNAASTTTTTTTTTSQLKSFQHNLQTKKEVANPYILGKVVEYFGIDELQSNFPLATFDPYGLPLHEYSETLAIEQKKRQDDRLYQQQQRTQIAFTKPRPTD